MRAFCCLLLFQLLLGVYWGTNQGLLERTEFADGTSERTLYDAEGRREYGYDRRGQGTQTIYDALGWVKETWFIGDGSKPAVRLSAQYDAAGRVWKSTDARVAQPAAAQPKAPARLGEDQPPRQTLDPATCICHPWPHARFDAKHSR